MVDRGYAILDNVKKLRRRKEPFLVSVKSQPKGLKLLEALGPQEKWPETRRGVRAAFVERDEVKWVVTWNDEVVGRKDDECQESLEKAREDLRRCGRPPGRGGRRPGRNGTGKWGQSCRCMG